MGDGEQTCESWQAVREELEPLAGGRTRDALVFTAPEGGPIRYPNSRRRDWGKAMKTAVQAAGVARVEHVGAWQS
ncbi:hypothetical protein [Streptomyces sp. NPDC058297]|uniref:hypothetical protein n=1 Tax=unclassified Streptomyces TaxID=2593676 RepID=UPI0036E8FDAC